MAKAKSTSTTKAAPAAFRTRSAQETEEAKKGQAHVFGNHARCKTDTLGLPTPHNRSPLEIVVDATEGFIPLWEKGSTLRWRFQDKSLAHFDDPEAAKAGMRELLGLALLEWGDAAPVAFAERDDAWDFEIAAREAEDCDINGCVLASAFFPDGGRHELLVYPTLLQQTKKEQVDTLVHEIGHIFGLRHFFAQISEKAWPSKVFGTHEAFSIMNYGAKSKLTAADKADLRKLYELVWSGEITKINGTPIRLVRPYHLA